MKDFVASIGFSIARGIGCEFHDKPDDYILATAESHTVRGFVEITFDAVEITIAWKGPRGI